MSQPKIDIFGILRAYDRRDRAHFQSIPPDNRPDYINFVRYPALRWMSGADKDVDHQMTLISANVVNPVWFSLQKHPDWQASLLAVIGSGKPVRHSYVQPPKVSRDNLLMDFVRLHYSSDLDIEDCEMALNDFTPEIFAEAASGMENKSDLIKAYTNWRQKMIARSGVGQKR